MSSHEMGENEEVDNFQFVRLIIEPNNSTLPAGFAVCAKSAGFLLCHSKNNPPAMQGEGRSLDISMNSCAKIEVGLQNHK